jgi:hypothetical protein
MSRKASGSAARKRRSRRRSGEAAFRVLKREMFSDRDVERFWSKVPIGDDDACWIWTGCRHRDGHGQFKFRGHVEYAHRVAYALTFGCTPYRRLVLHSCGGSGCCNPAHFYAGNHSQNAYDYWRQKQSDLAQAEQYA